MPHESQLSPTVLVAKSTGRHLLCANRMEKFTYTPETASTTAGGGGGARAARAASGGKAGAGLGAGLGSRGGEASTSGRTHAPRRNGAWIAGSNSMHFQCTDSE